MKSSKDFGYTPNKNIKDILVRRINFLRRYYTNHSNRFLQTLAKASVFTLIITYKFL